MEESNVKPYKDYRELVITPNGSDVVKFLCRYDGDMTTFSVSVNNVECLITEKVFDALSADNDAGSYHIEEYLDANYETYKIITEEWTNYT